MNLPRPLLSLALVLGVLIGAPASGDVVPSPLFQDHAVLQRDRPVPIWGQADPGEPVTVTFADQQHRTEADADGRWRVVLAPLPANAVPTTLTIEGHNRIVLSDILVGEVWLASGQSNMAWRVDLSHDADVVRRTARFPQIREITPARRVATQPAATFEGAWRPATPETVGHFSAVAYHFALDLHLALQVPVGIINATWGGTRIEAWMPKESLESEPAFDFVHEEWSRIMADYPEQRARHERELAAWQQAKAAAEAAGQVYAERAPGEPRGPSSPYAPSGLFNGMIAPLVPNALRGVIWYQGESNTGRSEAYHGLFSTLIRDWRAKFGQGDLPFFWVQLAGFHANDPQGTNWAALREAQARTLALPATGQAVTIDAATSDLRDIHPRDKQAVGRRLARLALAQVYGEVELATSAPVFASATLVPADTAASPASPAALRLTFTPADRRLRQPLHEPTGFEVAGPDRVFHPATARIQSDHTILVSSPAVPEPVAVRYAWRNAPLAGLQDDLGLPVPPFRSDDW